MSANTRVLIACTGSVAAVKVPLIIQQLHQTEPSFEIQLVVTDHSLHFFDVNSVSVKIHKDEDEWKWQKIGDAILHIELRRWADILIICPLDANTLAKIANGLCDNLLTCIVRAWDPKKPLLFAPAMNTLMWEHVLTQRHINTLKDFGYTEIPCVAKKLACADVGMGAMASVETIVQKIVQHTATTASTAAPTAAATTAATTKTTAAVAAATTTTNVSTTIATASSTNVSATISAAAAATAAVIVHQQGLDRAAETDGGVKKSWTFEREKS
ncbi:phosphopantothenoylcysteine decarboxylase-like isoform X1 [Argonauta hians]